MPNWKKLITSGSNASLASLHIVTGSSNALVIEGSGSIIFDVQGSLGQLFSITDSLTGTLFSVNDISGIPILTVEDDNTVEMGTFGSPELIVSQSVKPSRLVLPVGTDLWATA